MDDTLSLVKLARDLVDRPDLVIRTAAEWLRIRSRDGGIKALIANAAQKSFEERRGRQNIVLKARQMGITTWVSARFFLRTISRRNTLTLQVAHTREAAESIFCIVQRMWEELPEDMKQGALRRSRANVRQMVFPECGSEFRVASACEVGVGRGLSLQNLHCSEVGRWPGDAAATLAGLRASLAWNGELVLESTPNGAYGAFYDEWCKGVDVAKDGDRLVRHFFPWWLETAYVGRRVNEGTMNEAEQTLVARYGLSREQIGYRRSLEGTYGGLRSQEFAEDAETCFRATGSCFFAIEAIEGRMAQLENAEVSRRGGALQMWLPPSSGCRYIVGVDSAGGSEDGDYAAIQVIDQDTGLQCAELQERLRPSELAKVAVELAKEYRDALIAVERNNHGAAVLAFIDSTEGYRNVYRQKHEEGWLTTAASKPGMVALLGFQLQQWPDMFLSRRLLSECRTFVGGERGKTGAANGAHDDLVMAMGVGQPGRLHQLEGRVEEHERSMQRLKGAGIVFGGILTMLHLLIGYLIDRYSRL